MKHKQPQVSEESITNERLLDGFTGVKMLADYFAGNPYKAIDECRAAGIHSLKLLPAVKNISVTDPKKWLEIAAAARSRGFPIC